MYVRCDESSLYSRINYVHSPDGNPLRECPGIIKTMPQWAERQYRLHYTLTPLKATRKKPGRCDLAWKDLCSVLNALSK